MTLQATALTRSSLLLGCLDGMRSFLHVLLLLFLLDNLSVSNGLIALTHFPASQKRTYVSSVNYFLFKVKQEVKRLVALMQWMSNAICKNVNWERFLLFHTDRCKRFSWPKSTDITRSKPQQNINPTRTNFFHSWRSESKWVDPFYSMREFERTTVAHNPEKDFYIF